MGSKKFKGVPCVYCGQRASSTADHVFAREFFLKEHRADLPKVPACESCNGSKSTLEHHLATLLPFGGRHNHSQRTLADMVPGRLAKNEKLHRTLRRDMKRGWVSYNGIDIRVAAVPVDRETLVKWLLYVVRGLVWFHWHEYLRPGDRVRVSASNERLDAMLDAMAGLDSIRRIAVEIGGGAIHYEALQFEDGPTVTAWRISMYGGLTFTNPSSGHTSSSFVALTGPRLESDPPSTHHDDHAPT